MEEKERSFYDKIKDVAVIGLPDTRLGEIAAAIIELKSGMTATEEEMNEFCLELPLLLGHRLPVSGDCLCRQHLRP